MSALQMTDWVLTPYQLQNYAPIPEAGCWLWLGKWVGDERYGGMSRNGRNMGAAHRHFYAHHRGPIPAGLLVLHKCDTPQCVNPAHLFLGTASDNMRDMVNKGRIVTKVTLRRVPIDKAVEIASRTESARSLAREYGISTKTVRNARERAAAIAARGES